MSIAVGSGKNMERSNSGRIFTAQLALLVSRSDRISSRIEELIADGVIAGADLDELRSEHDLIAVQLARLLGDEGTDWRTSIWRARALLAEDESSST